MNREILFRGRLTDRQLQRLHNAAELMAKESDMARDTLMAVKELQDYRAREAIRKEKRNELPDR